MKDIILILAMLLTFSFGYYIMAKIDIFIAENEEAKEKYENDKDEERGRYTNRFD